MFATGIELERELERFQKSRDVEGLDLYGLLLTLQRNWLATVAMVRQPIRTGGACPEGHICPVQPREGPFPVVFPCGSSLRLLPQTDRCFWTGSDLGAKHWDTPNHSFLDWSF